MTPAKENPLEYGIVIDHIPANRAIDFVRNILDLGSYDLRDRLYFENVPSGKGEDLRKDIIKIRATSEYLSTLIDRVSGNTGNLGLISENIKIVIIEDGKVVKKYHPEVPDVVEGIVSCPNPKCVTETEPYAVSKFEKEKENSSHLACLYCEEHLNHDEVLARMLA